MWCAVQTRSGRKLVLWFAKRCIVMHKCWQVTWCWYVSYAFVKTSYSKTRTMPASRGSWVRYSMQWQKGPDFASRPYSHCVRRAKPIAGNFGVWWSKACCCHLPSRIAWRGWNIIAFTTSCHLLYESVGLCIYIFTNLKANKSCGMIDIVTAFAQMIFLIFCD